MRAHAEIAAADRAAAIDILLVMAEANAGWGEYDRALDRLDDAEHAGGPLPASYELKRLNWLHRAQARP